MGAVGGASLVVSSALEGVAQASRLVAPGGVLGGLRAGARVEGWQIVAISDVRDGAIHVEMEGGGRRFAVEVMRRDPRFAGVAHTAQLELYLRNQGDGARRSDEIDGLGVMALARALSAREAAGARHPSLLTLRERAARFRQYAAVRG